MVDLLEELKKTKALSGKISFLAHKEEIEKALDAGYSKKDIWKVLKKNNLISISYEQFVHYTKTLIEKKERKSKPGSSKDAKEKVKPKKFTYKEKEDEDLI